MTSNGNNVGQPKQVKVTGQSNDYDSDVPIIPSLPASSHPTIRIFLETKDFVPLLSVRGRVLRTAPWSKSLSRFIYSNL